jgi:hypothetical protein
LFVQETQLTFLFQNEENLDKLVNVDDENGDEDNDDVVVASAMDVEGDLTANLKAVQDEVEAVNHVSDEVEAEIVKIEAVSSEVEAVTEKVETTLGNEIEEFVKDEQKVVQSELDENLSQNFEPKEELAGNQVEDESKKELAYDEVETKSVIEEPAINSVEIIKDEISPSAITEDIQQADNSDAKSITSEKSTLIINDDSISIHQDHASIKSEDPPSPNDNSPNHRPLTSRTFNHETNEDIFEMTSNNDDKIALDPKVDILIIERNNELNEDEDEELAEKDSYDYEYDDNDDVILSHERNLSAENNPIETGESTKEVSV